jgi:hypothetical protein
MRCNNLFFMAALAAATVSMTSCNNDDEIIDSNSRLSNVALEVTAGIATETPQTRVQGTTWQTGDAIGIFQLETGTLMALDVNSKYVNTTGSTFAPADATQTIYFPIETTPTSDFIAYYPYNDAQANYLYSIDVTNQSNQEAIDLLTADKVTGKDKAAPAVAFNFKHRLSKLELNLTAGNGIITSDLAGIAITITGQQLETTFDLYDGVLATPSGTTQAITLKTASNGLTAEAIIIPAAASAGRQLTFTLSGGEEFVWNIPDTKEFQAGQKNIYNITLNRTSIDVTSTITDWTAGNGAGESGSAE